MLQDLALEGATVVKSRVEFKNRVASSAEIYAAGTHLEDLQPREVFQKLLTQEAFDHETQQLLQEAFEELLDQQLNQAQYED
jgi:exonuclease SbcD